MDKRLILLVGRVPKALTGALVSSVIAAFMMIIQALLISRILNDIFLLHMDFDSVQHDLGLLLAVSLSRSFFIWSGRVQSSRLSIGIREQLRLALFQSLMKSGSSVQSHDAGRLYTTLMEGVETLHAYFSAYLPQIILAVLVPLLVLIFIFPADLISGFVLLITAPIIPVFMVLIGNRADKKSKAQWLSLSMMSTHFLDILRGLTTLKIFGRANEQTGHIARVSDHFRLATMGVLKIAFLSALVLELAAMISTALIAVEVGLRLLYHHMEFQQAMFILILAPEFYQPLRQLGASYHAGLSGIAAAESIFPILDAVPTQPMNGSAVPSSGSGPLLVFEQLSCRYDQHQTPVLKNLNISIDQGETYFIIGPSGSGKSTLFSLLLRFIHPQEGQIRFKDQALSGIDTMSWRNQLIWLPQRPYLLHQSIEDNLRFANPDAKDDDLQEACKRAELHTFIISLRDGYKTIIGEQGARLSAGQAQRMALARAFLKNGNIMLLDEPMSSLDAQLEQAVWQNIQDFAKGKTTLIISHHIHLIKPENRIILLVNGEIRQAGFHSHLRNTPGFYRDICEKGGFRN